MAASDLPTTLRSDTDSIDHDPRLEIRGNEAISRARCLQLSFASIGNSAARRRAKSPDTPCLDRFRASAPFRRSLDSGEPQTATVERDAKERMLAAIIARNGPAWFFKLVGPGGSVAEQTEPFRKFVESVNFTGEGSIPEWKLPEGWRQQPGSGMRMRPSQINTPQQPLELTVTPLKTGDGDFEDYVLANVDRWRQQLGLPPTSKASLFGRGRAFGELIEVKCARWRDSLMVNLAGEHGSGPASGLAGSSPPLPSDPRRPGLADDRPGNGPPLTYEAPTGWSPARSMACVRSHSRSATNPRRPRLP